MQRWSHCDRRPTKRSSRSLSGKTSELEFSSSPITCVPPLQQTRLSLSISQSNSTEPGEDLLVEMDALRLDILDANEEILLIHRRRSPTVVRFRRRDFQFSKQVSPSKIGTPKSSCFAPLDSFRCVRSELVRLTLRRHDHSSSNLERDHLRAATARQLPRLPEASR